MADERALTEQARCIWIVMKWNLLMYMYFWGRNVKQMYYRRSGIHIWGKWTRKLSDISEQWWNISVNRCDKNDWKPEITCLPDKRKLTHYMHRLSVCHTLSELSWDYFERRIVSWLLAVSSAGCLLMVAAHILSQSPALMGLHMILLWAGRQSNTHAAALTLTDAHKVQPQSDLDQHSPTKCVHSKFNM